MTISRLFIILTALCGMHGGIALMATSPWARLTAGMAGLVCLAILWWYRHLAIIERHATPLEDS